MTRAFERSLKTKILQSTQTSSTLTSSSPRLITSTTRKNLRETGWTACIIPSSAPTPSAAAVRKICTYLASRRKRTRRNQTISIPSMTSLWFQTTMMEAQSDFQLSARVYWSRAPHRSYSLRNQTLQSWCRTPKTTGRSCSSLRITPNLRAKDIHSRQPSLRGLHWVLCGLWCALMHL